MHPERRVAFPDGLSLQCHSRESSMFLKARRFEAWHLKQVGFPAVFPEQINERHGLARR